MRRARGGAAAATHRLCLLKGRDSSRRTRSPGPHAFSSSCACAAAEAARLGLVLQTPAAGRHVDRTIYFLVSRSVLPSRVWRNKRVTATVTLFIILLDTTCACFAVSATRGGDSSGPRAVPTSERGMPATARRPLGRRKRRRAALRDGRGAAQQRRPCRAGLAAQPLNSWGGNGACVIQLYIYLCLCEAAIGLELAIRTQKARRQTQAPGSSRYDLASLGPLVRRRRRHTRPYARCRGVGAQGDPHHADGAPHVHGPQSR